jgi:hypothetical protein
MYFVVLCNKHYTIKPREKQPSIAKSIFNMAMPSVRASYKPVEIEESIHFLDEFDTYFGPQVCTYSIHLQDISIDLLRSVSRLVVDMNHLSDKEITFKPIDSLSPQTKTYIILIFDFLALISQQNANKFIEAWLPFDKVIQHVFNLTDNINKVLEVMYQYHPELQSILTPEFIKIVKDALNDCATSPLSWPARLMKAILLNPYTDSIQTLAKVYTVM